MLGALQGPRRARSTSTTATSPTSCAATCSTTRAGGDHLPLGVRPDAGRGAAPTSPTVTLLLQVADDSGHDLLPVAQWYEDALGRRPGRLPPVAAVARRPLHPLHGRHDRACPRACCGGRPTSSPALFGGRLANGEAAPRRRRWRRRRPPRCSCLPAPPFMHGAAHWIGFNAWSTGGNRRAARTDPSAFDPADIWRAIERERVTVLADRRVTPSAGRCSTSSSATSYDLSSRRPAHQRRGGAVGGGQGRVARPRLPRGDDPRRPRRRPRPAPRPPDHRRRAGGSTGHVHPRPRHVHPLRGPHPPPRAGRRGARLAGPAGPGAARLPRRRGQDGGTFPVIDGVRYSRARRPGPATAPTALPRAPRRDSVTINSGGEKIFAEEVEAALAAPPRRSSTAS